MRPIKLLTDSTCDLSDETIKQNDIGIIPLYVNFGTRSYKDNVDIKTADLFSKVKETGKLPTTSAPTVADFSAEFKKYINKDMDILHISISSRISASYQNACTAAAQFPEGRIKVIDSWSLSTGIGILDMVAADCIKEGMTLEDTFNTVQSKVPKVRVQFILDTVEYLHKGGRCSGLQMLLSSILEIHPIIKVTEGSIHMAAKVRGNRQAVLNSLVKNAVDNLKSMDKKRVFISNTEYPEGAAWVKDQLAKTNAIKQILITGANCVIASHCGPNVVSIVYIEI
jgi:DegV family protein with EDD domain